MQSGGGNQHQTQRHLVNKEVRFTPAHERTDGNFAVKFDYDNALVEYIKELPLSQRTWSGEERAWLCPLEHLEDVRAHFRAAGVRISYTTTDPGLIREKMDMVPKLCEDDVEEHLGKLPEELFGRLFPCALAPFPSARNKGLWTANQRAGVEFGVKRNGKVLIADEPGLGKTVQAIAIAAAFVEDWPLLVVCPSSVRSVWQQQLREWLPRDVWASCSIISIMKGEDVKKALGHGPRPRQITIASYDLVQKLERAFCSRHRFIICDESHMLANSTTNRTKFLMPLVQQSPHAVLLSGTPLQAKPIELFTQIEMMRPKLLGSRDDYGRRYCGGYKQQLRPGFSDYVGKSNIEELHALLEATIMIRRLKKQVLQDLPDKMRSTIYVDIDANTRQNLYRIKKEMDEVDSLPGMSEDAARAAKQQLVNELYRATGQAKIPGAVAHLQQLLDAGHKVLVFAHHGVVMDALEDAAESLNVPHVRIDGSTIPARRTTAVQDFQGNADVRVALLSIKAAGTGLTLTEASAVMFAELAWTPADLTQAEDRAHRVGQDKILQVHYLMASADESADEMMWKKLRGKLRTVGQIVDGNRRDTAAGLNVNGFQVQFTPPERPANASQPLRTPASGPAGPSQPAVAPGGPRKVPRSFANAGPSSQPGALSQRFNEDEPPAARRKLDFGGASVPVYRPLDQAGGAAVEPIDLTGADDEPAAAGGAPARPFGEGPIQGFRSSNGTPASRRQTQEELAGVFGTPGPSRRQTADELAGVFGNEPEENNTAGVLDDADNDVICLD